MSKIAFDDYVNKPKLQRLVTFKDAILFINRPDGDIIPNLFVLREVMQSENQELKASFPNLSSELLTDITLPPNSLFLFYDDPDNHNLVPNIRIHSSSSIRQAKYIPLRRNTNLPAIEIPNYKYFNQHQSIDRYVDLASPVLSSSHFTIEFQHITNSNEFLIIHVYFNQRHERNGEIRAKIIERDAQNQTERLISFYTPMHSLTEIILLHAEDSENLLIKLSLEQSKKIVGLLNDMAACDSELAEYCANISSPEQRTSAIQTINKYISIVEKLRRYGLDNNRDTYLINLLEILSQKENQQTITPSISNPTQQLENNAVAIPRNSALEEKNPWTVKREQVAQLMQQLKEYDKSAKASDSDHEIYIKIYTITKDIKDILLELDFNDSKKITREFTRKKRTELSKHTDVIALFHARCIDGDIDFVKKLFPALRNDIDLIDLFTNLIVTIRENKSPLVTKQIDVARYFHQHSEIMRHYMSFLSSNIYLINSVGCSLLMQSFLDDHFELFKFLLETSFTLTQYAYFDHERGRALDMTQGLIGFFIENPQIKYMQVICEYKPNMESARNHLSNWVFSHNHKTPARTLSEFSAIFKDLGTTNATSKKAAAKGYKIVKPAESNQATTNQQQILDKIHTICTGNKNMLQIGLPYHADTTPEMIRLIAEHSRIQTLLVEFMNTLGSYNYCYELHFATSGGTRYLENVHHMKLHHLGTNICMYFYLSEEGKRGFSDTANHNNQQSTRYLIDTFTTKFLALTPEKQNDFVESNIKLAAQIPEHKGHHYYGALIAISMLPQNQKNCQLTAYIMSELAEIYSEKNEFSESMRLNLLTKDYIERLPEAIKGQDILNTYELVTSKINLKTMSFK